MDGKWTTSLDDEPHSKNAATGVVEGNAAAEIENSRTKVFFTFYHYLECALVGVSCGGVERVATGIVTNPSAEHSEVYRDGGIRGLWRGLGPNLVGVIPARSIYFGVYGTSKATLAELNGREESWVHMLSAAVAGATSATITSPIWLVKTRMQLQSGGQRLYRNSFHCFQTVVRNEGIRGLYKGTSASYLGISESTIQFVVYEWLKKLYRDRRRRESRAASTFSSLQDWVDSFVVAATAKLLASAATYPHEVVRTRMREQPPDGTHSKYKGLVQTFKTVYREESFRGLYGGMSTHLIRVVPNAAIMFTFYELAVRMRPQGFSVGNSIH
ncbi:hypothetical protein HDU93_007343 [Gonapodya sp. JEL0774]|nr:hypothetical protein HDU93_007343 [Gonapodya sp. JEL0774]